MLTNKTYAAILLLISFILLTACGSSRKVAPQPYRPLDLRGQSESFISGANDGCETAVEKYKKDHDAFNYDGEYNKGWWAGRRNCEARAKFYNDDI
jgi:hypothetical protein